MDKITKSMDEFRIELRGNTAAIHAHTAKLDDLVAWRPDLEHRVDQLTNAVAELQQGRPPAAAALGVAPQGSSTIAPALAAAGIHPGDEPTAQVQPHGSNDHRNAFLHREQRLATPPAPLPGTGQYSLQSPGPVVSPFSHARQLLAGLGQAHPSVVFPQFAGENPKLLKTLCEQYFGMFGIHSTFWVPMAALNFSGPASIWLQLVQNKLSDYDWESFAALLCTRFGRDRH